MGTQRLAVLDLGLGTATVRRRQGDGTVSVRWCRVGKAVRVLVIVVIIGPWLVIVVIIGDWLRSRLWLFGTSRVLPRAIG